MRVFVSLTCVTKGRAAASRDCVCRSGFHGGCTATVPDSASQQRSFLSVCLTEAGGGAGFSLALICMSLMANDSERLFM